MIFLDTSVCIDFLRGNVGTRKRLRLIPLRQVAVSSIVILELEKGLAMGEADYQKLRRADMVSLLDNIAILDFDPAAARIAAKLLAKYKVQGRERGFFDLLIAAHANSRKAVLATSDGGQSGIATRRELWPKAG